MAKNTQPVLKRCKTLGLSPAVLGYSKSTKRQPKQTRRKQSEYGMQLNEKQKVKFIYGVLEKQFHHYYEKAERKQGITGEILLQELERRLDNVVFRMGFANTRREARQLVNHGHFTVNGKRVNIPSFQVKPGDVVAVSEKSRSTTKFKSLLEENGITAYNEETHTGRVRHLYMRQGWHSGQRLLCFVVNGNGLPNEAEICAILQKEFDLTTVLINRNSERTNVILGRKTRTAAGPGVIEDTLAGVPLHMGVHEFYQVNTPAAEVLYAKARAYAGLKPDDFLLDLYCGMGTIGLSMLPDCQRLVGVEVVPQAVEGAKETAARLGLGAEKADFRCQDAGAAAAQLAAEGARPDVIVVDPPRKGCDEATLTAIAEMAPRTVVMVSCNAATAARDTRWLTEHGYKAVEVQPVDLFPRTKHVECVVKLTKDVK